jgi:hypothetical protein
MEALVNIVTEKTGISPELAQKAVDITLNFLKDKLPAPVAEQIDGLMSGEGGGEGGVLGGLAKGIGGIMGKEEE